MSPTRFELLLSYLAPLEAALSDPEITEIMVHPGDNGQLLTFVERNGEMERTDITVRPDDIQSLARDIARRQLGREINADTPKLSATLENGSRISILIPPAVETPSMTIRNFRDKLITVAELVESGSLPVHVATTAERAIRSRQNILISGPNGTGKTTLLIALASQYIPAARRVVVLEDDVREIRLPNHENKLHVCAGVHGTMSEFLKEALRHRIQNVIVGEVRGAEALDLLNALNTGHSGSLATIHADAAGLALYRLETCAAMANSGLSDKAIRRNIVNAIHYVIQLEQKADGSRAVSEMVKVRGYNSADGEFTFDPVWPPEQRRAVDLSSLL
jgi:pilus assembly protein CpaF